MRHRVFTLAVLGVIGSFSSPVPVQAANPAPAQAAVAPIAPTSPDYALAGWIPASPANYTVSDRPDSYQVNMIVIHSIEGSYSSAITAFQDPTRAGSAHYVISRTGRIAQMVLEKDIAWHAGNWDYNTRAIGIEHEGYAALGNFTLAEYQASAKLAASICSRWGVHMDRTHVIGHYQVPDPNNPALGGGLEHHTDPGPYWDWTNYMNMARSYASALPSPPHMGPDPTAASGEGGITLSWQPAQSCTLPITGYTLTGTPGNISMTLPATTTSVWIPGLTDGVAYSFTVTAINAQGTSTLTSNTAIPGLACTAASLTGNAASPRPAGASTVFTATSTACNSPEYAYWVKAPGKYWSLQRDYGGDVWTWNTTGLAPGTYQLEVWARQRGSANQYDTYGATTYVLAASGCQSAGLAPGVPAPQVRGTQVTFTASATGCTSPQYQFLLLPPGGAWAVVQPYSASATWLFDSSKYANGNFQVGVWARQAGSSSRYQTFFLTTYWIHVAGGCVVSGLTPGVASPPVAGASVTFTPRQTGCANQYKFWLLAPGGQWRVVQQYGVGGTWTWNTAAYAPGIYQVGVWEGRTSTPSKYESFAITTFTLAPGICASTSLSPSAAPPQTPGAVITLTATSTGCASPTYEFWVAAPRGAWTVARGYGGATFDWNTTGLAPGLYQVGVWARRAGSTASYEAYFVGSYQLTVPACASATITANPSSPQAAGTSVMFTATSSGCGSPRYQFWEQAPGGIWKVVQAWGIGTTFTWDSTGAAIGDYNFAVMALATGSAGPYDTYALTTFSINA